MNAPAAPAMFQRASRDMSTLLATLQAISPTELPIVPRASYIEAVQVDCRAVVEAAAEFVRARMKDVEYTTGADMEAKNADWITAGFDGWCDPSFGEAIRAISDTDPPAHVRFRQQPGLDGRPA